MKDKYISPFTDFGFKKLFGTEFNKPLLIDFLNEILGSETGKIKMLNFLSTEKLAPASMNVKLFLISTVKMSRGKNLLLNYKKQNKTTLKIAAFTILPFPYKSRLKEATGILN